VPAAGERLRPAGLRDRVAEVEAQLGLVAQRAPKRAPIAAEAKPTTRPKPTPPITASMLVPRMM
jgi:hypothetical protein